MLLSAAKRNGEIFFQSMNQNHQETLMSTQLPTYQQTPISSEAKDAETAISHGMLAYFRGRLSNKIHELVLTEFAEQEKEGKTSRAELARRIRRKPEQITRWLGSPGNWTLDTFSDLLLGMGLEPTVSVRNLAGERVVNFGTEQHSLWVHVQTPQEVARDMSNGNHKSLYFSLQIMANTYVNATTIEVHPTQDLNFSPAQPDMKIPAIQKIEGGNLI
jgi:hypothetical protein